MTQVLCECLQCGSVFHRWSSDLRRGNGKYCSHRCRSKHRYILNPYLCHPSPYERFFRNISFSSHVQDCWIWEGLKNKGGYGRIVVNQKEIPAHRYSYILHKGSIPPKHFVCHHCDNPSCVNPEHLFMGTPSENSRDRHKKGMHRDDTGSKHPMALLDEEKVQTIRLLLKDGKQGSILAKKFGVSSACIYSIKSRKTWKHI